MWSWLLLVTKYFFHPISIFPKNFCISNICTTRAHFFRFQIILCKKEVFNHKIFQLANSASRKKPPLHFYSFCFQMIKENQQFYLNPSIKYSHALLNHRDMFWEKHHWGILLCKRHRVHLHKPRWDSPLHTLGYLVFYLLYLLSVMDWNIMWAGGWIMTTPNFWLSFNNTVQVTLIND